MADDEMKAELERLRAENERLKTRQTRGVSLKVSEKGGVSVYGLGRFPVTLYKEQWMKLLDIAGEIRAFAALARQFPPRIRKLPIAQNFARNGFALDPSHHKPGAELVLWPQHIKHFRRGNTCPICKLHQGRFGIQPGGAGRRGAITRRRATQDRADIEAGLAIDRDQARAIADQAAGLGKGAHGIDCRNGVACGQRQASPDGFAPSRSVRPTKLRWISTVPAPMHKPRMSR